MDNRTVVGAFSEDAAAKLSGLSVSQLRRWDKSGFLSASYAAPNRRSPYSRVYSFRDIVSLRVLGVLTNKHKVSMQHLKKVASKLESLGDEKWTSTTLYVLEKRVVFDDPQTNERKEVVSGQRVFDLPLAAAISDTHEAILKLNRRRPGDGGMVHRARFVASNEPVFLGTRVPVAAVKRYLDAGFDVDAIIQEFPDLTLKDVEAAKSIENGLNAA